MQLCRYYMPLLGARVGAIIDGDVYDMTEAEPGRPRTLATLLGRIAGFPPGGFVEWVMDKVEDKVEACSLADLYNVPEHRVPHLLAPIDGQEVWAAGVTYERSLAAREAESHQSGIYDRVYTAPRPELFFKANAHHVVGPHLPIRVRTDSQWSVPEPELALVMDSRGTLVGYTVGNDVSARDIEGDNPLYLPQAKVYNQSCALGPVITLADGLDPKNTAIRLEIKRGDEMVFQGETSTASIVRPFTEMIEYLWRENDFPQGVFLLTGTGIIPPDDVKLQDGDEVAITIEGIGTLVNPVVQRR